MNLIKVLHKSKVQFLIKLSSNETYKKFIVSFFLVSLIAAIIWLVGPYITWKGYAFLAQPEKRLYSVLFLFLLWTLKFLIIDIEKPFFFQLKDAVAQKYVVELQKRFQGAYAFLRRTTAAKHSKPINLHTLPWYLLIGPSQAGKTTLLVNSSVNFILQRRLQPQSDGHLLPSEHCDWWVTQQASIIDVPGKYLVSPFRSTQQKRNPYSYAWEYFLYLIKKYRGKNGINGIIIAVPLPEMLAGNSKALQTFTSNLVQCIQQIHYYFPQALSCQLLITKCDLLPGFIEFFSESSKEEAHQAWGITFTKEETNEKISDTFVQRFDSLIKKLNQQLIWRLHHERDHLARPAIKDFPLQVERLKNPAADFINTLFATPLKLTLQSIYLTSAHQPYKETAPEENDTITLSKQSVPLLQQPERKSRAYFIKQFINYGLIQHVTDTNTAPKQRVWKRCVAYSGSAGAILLATLIFGRDFDSAVRQTQHTQSLFADYQSSIQHIHNADERLLRTLSLLSSLKPPSSSLGWYLNRLLTYYTHQSAQQATVIYQQALQTILIPEIRNYLGDYLKTPVNRNIDDLYAVLKAYLMLSDATQFQAEFVTATMRQILTKSFSDTAATQLLEHIHVASSTGWNPPTLDTNLIEQTRKYLMAMPSVKLSYAILKTMHNNSKESDINLGVNIKSNTVLTSQQLINQIPTMFTTNAFTTIYTQEIPTAAQESLTGNWVLGQNISISKNTMEAAQLTDQLRTTYINNYIDVWEGLLANIQLSSATDLSQTNRIITTLSSNRSPLLQFLRTLHDNTYFEPITSMSPKLKNLGTLLDKHSQTPTLLYQIFTALQSLNQSIQPVLVANNSNKAAFDIVANRMQNHVSPDAITQLRLIAATSPEPIKTWLEKIADDTWHFLEHEAVNYIDLSWQNQVMPIYHANIAAFYPFNPNSQKEIDVAQFTRFFGQPGIIANFYQNYLRPFIDTSNSEWRWKKIDNESFPLSNVYLGQLQQAMRINHTFFPHGDNTFSSPFALQPYQLSNQTKAVVLNINDKLISGNVAWDEFKLLNPSLDSVINNGHAILNFSPNEQTVKYTLTAENQKNPFSNFDFQHFQLPIHFSDTNSNTGNV